MSHYSDAYEYEDEQARKAEKKVLKEDLKEVRQLRQRIDFNKRIPQRFKDSLEDLENYLSYRPS
jgi:hypothetical protein